MSGLPSLALIASVLAGSAGDVAAKHGALLGAADACHLDEARLKRLDKAALKAVVAASRDPAERDDALMGYASAKAEALADHLDPKAEYCAGVARKLDGLEEGLGSPRR